MKFDYNKFSHDKTQESLLEDLDKILGDLNDVENDINSLYKALSRICRALEEDDEGINEGSN
jgi:hypothetical protein